MNRLVWIVTIPIAILVVLFAVVNRGPVALNLWPFPWEIEAPLFLFTLGAIVFGFLFGALASWVSAGATRVKLRQAQRDLAQAQGELAALKRAQPVPPVVVRSEATPPAILPPSA